MVKVRSILRMGYLAIGANLYLVEFILGVIKILACTGFILFAIIDDCGGVPTDSRGYIGAQ
jgi:amino acid permease